ncbi:MAG TPA: hypothetical protein VF952_07075 [Chloroflexia bacterium]|jgi:hypothetical protein
MPKITFFPLGNADSCRIDLDSGKKLLFDFGNMRNPNDKYDLRIDLAAALLEDLRAARRDYFDVFALTHLDDDHYKGASEFFWLEHDPAYQGEGRVKIKEFWVPAAVILEDTDKEEAKILQAEARHRAILGEGIRIFSRPEKLRQWLKDHGSVLYDDDDFVIDAGHLVPCFDKVEDGVEFFVHSPFAVASEGKPEDRNEGSLVFQAVFRVDGVDTRVMLTADTICGNLAAIVDITNANKYRHGGVDRLGWDVFKLPHHCSYRSLSSVKGEEITEPLPQIKELFEVHGSDRSIIVSPSKPIPDDADDDADDQPPHRQAANYYESVRDNKNGKFIVTMQHPTKVRPEPLVIVIDRFGATPQETITRGTVAVTTHAAPRAG